jgi:hypothetical protein
LAGPEIQLNSLAIFRAYASLTITAGYFSELHHGRRKTLAQKKAAGPKPRRLILLAMLSAI